MYMVLLLLWFFLKCLFPVLFFYVGLFSFTCLFFLVCLLFSNFYIKITRKNSCNVCIYVKYTFLSNFISFRMSICNYIYGFFVFISIYDCFSCFICCCLRFLFSCLLFYLLHFLVRLLFTGPTVFVFRSPHNYENYSTAQMQGKCKRV